MAAIKRKADDTADGNVPSITMAKHKASDDNLALFNSLNGDNSSGDTNDSGSPESKNDSDSGTTNRISTTTSGFEVRAYENGILSPNSSKPAQDLDAIRHHLTRTP
ncbi:hypothetical protein B0T25DRAFT_576242 [Lasiosphaeria hispida]|uniref:Uncharacterized protein n=1 Tax=Lasiosphaeria hispida TaxID=260671 RepID=A0AAJ0MKD2_9PEZI|nr:hypothetical protein B0T25DRAFT_576242 [Lasiosphaeria hispida]